MKTDIIIHKTNGRKTTNDALITLLRAGMIASIMMLVLGAGMATAFDNPRDGGESTDIQSAPLGVVRSASSYDPQAAVTYSDSWWDGKNGSYKYYYSYYWGGVAIVQILYHSAL
ncbi:MAG: hypothetical protein EMLJLAPB_01153 [Candidatus Argoarchaeum ethanivorans]|uniref:Uncharacterized protein n=1 Tax=Candidatus Argoarchaeum ethanivorans TaxID=2608793 RepID=A0A811TH31_9EURY|nr:MAG: hypothetical protein EMLJLAPB_01153 [Candidatus Argoarchaeum ethanivorans]